MSPAGLKKKPRTGDATTAKKKTLKTRRATRNLLPRPCIEDHGSTGTIIRKRPAARQITETKLHPHR